MINFFKNNNRSPIGISSDNWEKSEWMGQELVEGQLSIDVYHNETEIVVRSTIAGTKPENLSISLHNDMLTIKGKRDNGSEAKEENYLYKECYWGPFSRSLFLPAIVDPASIEAYLENGVLTIVLKKIVDQAKIKIKIKD